MSFVFLLLLLFVFILIHDGRYERMAWYFFNHRLIALSECSITLMTETQLWNAYQQIIRFFLLFSFAPFSSSSSSSSCFKPMSSSNDRLVDKLAAFLLLPLFRSFFISLDAKQMFFSLLLSLHLHYILNDWSMLFIRKWFVTHVFVCHSFFSNDSISISQLTMKFIFFRNLFCLEIFLFFFANGRARNNKCLDDFLWYLTIDKLLFWHDFLSIIFREAISLMLQVIFLESVGTIPVDNQTIHQCFIFHHTMIMVDHKTTDNENDNKRILIVPVFLSSPLLLFDLVFVFICTERTSKLAVLKPYVALLCSFHRSLIVLHRFDG